MYHSPQQTSIHPNQSSQSSSASFFVSRATAAAIRKKTARSHILQSTNVSMAAVTNSEAVPAWFRCPISMEIMGNPVTLCTGITYDRSSIHTWLHRYKQRTCPVTKELLPSLDLTPNHTLLRMIQAWTNQNTSANSNSNSNSSPRPEPVRTSGNEDSTSGPAGPTDSSSPELLRTIAMQLSGPGATVAAAALASSASSVQKWDFLSVTEFRGLVDLLGGSAGGSASAAALKVLSYACEYSRRNSVDAVSAGSVSALTELLAEAERVAVSERVLCVLHVLVRIPEGCSAVADHALAVPLLCRKIGRVSAVGTAAAVGVLRRLCKSGQRLKVLKEMLACGAVTKLVLVLQVECDSVTRKRAMLLLRMLSKEFQGSPCLNI